MNLLEAPFLTASRVLRAFEVGTGYQDRIFAISQARFLGLTEANQPAFSRREDVRIAFTIPVLTVPAGMVKTLHP
jgi:hypothetical protein